MSLSDERIFYLVHLRHMLFSLDVVLVPCLVGLGVPHLVFKIVIGHWYISVKTKLEKHTREHLSDVHGLIDLRFGQSLGIRHLSFFALQYQFVESH